MIGHFTCQTARHWVERDVVLSLSLVRGGVWARDYYPTTRTRPAMASEQGRSGTPEAPSIERANLSVTLNWRGFISTVVRRELTAHQRCTDTSPTDGGESREVAIVRSAIPSHGGIEGERTVGGHAGYQAKQAHQPRAPACTSERDSHQCPSSLPLSGRLTYVIRLIAMYVILQRF